MLIIRLQRAGKRNKPDFRIVLAEKESSAAKKITEILGHYNPRTKDFAIKEDRLQYWVAQHVSMSPTAQNLLVTKKLIDLPKVKAFSTPKKVVEPVKETPAPAAEVVAEAPADTAEPAAAEEAPTEVTEAPVEAAPETETPAA